MGVIEAVFKAFESDPEGASVLVDEAMSSFLHEQTLKYEPHLQTYLAGRVVGTTALAKRALARSYVETMSSGHYPDESVHKTAGWLAGIEAYAAAVMTGVDKAFGWETWQLSNSKDVRRRVNRDANGRFAYGINTGMGVDPRGAGRNRSPALTAEQEEGAERQNPNEWFMSQGYDDRVTAARHQAQWEQANKYASELASAYQGKRSGVVIGVRYLSPSEGEQTLELPLKDVQRKGLGGIFEGEQRINWREDTILAVHLDTKGDVTPEVAASVQRFNTVGGLNSDTLNRLAQVKPKAWERAFKPYDYADDQNTRLTQAFGNIKGAGQVLSALPGGQKASELANLVGSMGPQAEEVLGPHVRRAAYRYRGTEKTPDRELVQDYRSGEIAALRRAADNPQIGDIYDYLSSSRDKGGAGLEDRMRPGQKLSPVAGSSLYRAEDGSTDKDQLKLQVNSDVAAGHLVSKLPTDSITAELSMRSGHVLPSQGVLLDSDGKLVSQAVGYADDHYLPFDLRNLGRLRGGQYVRTRVQGGLTGEDIYAAVQSGARMVTVVSGSGVYTLELDPHFRGARGQSDKAHSMYTRYLKILDAVEDSPLYLKDLDGPEKAKVKADVRELYPDQRDYEEHIDEAMDRRRRDKASLSEDQLNEMWEQAKADAAKEVTSGSGGELGRRTTDLYNDAVDEAKANSVSRLGLNAQGYQIALETLQQQFPYFIRKVSYEPLTTRNGMAGFFDRRRLDTSPAKGRATGKTDAGYVRPGSLRPSTVKGGYYHPEGPDLRPKREVEEKKTEEPATTATGGGGGEGAAATSSGGGGGPATGALPKLLESLQGEAAAKVKAQTEALQVDLTVIPRGERVTAAPPWESIKGDSQQDQQVRVQSMLENPGTLSERIKDPLALAALGNKNAVAGAFNNLFEGLGDRFTSGDLGEDFKEKYGTSAPAVRQHVVDATTEIANQAAISTPFAGEATDRAFYTGASPQALREQMGFVKPEQVAAFIRTDQGKRAESAREELFQADWSPQQVAAEAKKTVESLSEVNRAYADAKKVAEAARKPVDTAALAARTTMSEDQLRKVLGGDPKFADLTAQVQRRAMDVQHAWTLDAVERAHRSLSGGGGAGPKVQKAYSSRSARVLPREHPWVEPVRLAKAAGLVGSRSHRL